MEDPGSLRSLVGSVLGAVQAYDREHDSELVRTVQTWLERDRQGGPAAAALQIHPNTLAYRLRRFEEVSGRNLRSTAELAELWLAPAADPAWRRRLSCCVRAAPRHRKAYIEHALALKSASSERDRDSRAVGCGLASVGRLEPILWVLMLPGAD